MGVALAFVSLVFFRPIRNKTIYRMVMAVMGFIVTFACLTLFTRNFIIAWLAEFWAGVFPTLWDSCLAILLSQLVVKIYIHQWSVPRKP
ncbi:MAG TPA: hypothetical protein PLD47_06820 [Aggregatilineales bacterium]|nr:hypothetical protein [Anaerolineales bacterium]HRE47421.1 hypothetical protein [Aggregatilineales bacterium]